MTGVLGWLTGQRHRPIDGDPLTIIVNFDHDCLDRNPQHTICFPRVAACVTWVTQNKAVETSAFLGF